MPNDLTEATPIGRLLGDCGKTIAWVYQWDTSELSILWLSEISDPTSMEFAPHEQCDGAISKDIDNFLRVLLADGEKD